MIYRLIYHHAQEKNNAHTYTGKRKNCAGTFHVSLSYHHQHHHPRHHKNVLWCMQPCNLILTVSQRVCNNNRPRTRQKPIGEGLSAVKRGIFGVETDILSRLQRRLFVHLQQQYHETEFFPPLVYSCARLPCSLKGRSTTKQATYVYYPKMWTGYNTNQ